MYRTEALFFDGLSSVSHPIELRGNRQTNVFSFQIADSAKPVIWELADIYFEKYGNYLEIRNKNDKTAFIQIADEEFIKEFILHLRTQKRVGIYDRLLLLGIKKLALIGVGVFAIIVGGYFLLIPVLAKSAAEHIPDDFDLYLGEKFMENYLDGVYVDSACSVKVNDFASELLLENRYPLQFTVVDSEEVNAFALPDGNVVIYTALLDQMESYEELAGLIGHEVMHINHRHSVEMLCRNLSGYIFLSLLISDINGLMAIIAENVHSLNTLSYSRKHEQEADLGGVKLMIINNLDPNGMLCLFERLKSNVHIPQIVSTHPIMKNRVEYIKAYIEKTPHKIQHNTTLASIFSEIQELRETDGEE